MPSPVIKFYMHVREQHAAYYSTTNKAKCVYFVIFYHRERIEHEYTYILHMTSDDVRKDTPIRAIFQIHKKNKK